MTRSFATETMAKTCDKDFCGRDVHNFVKGDLIQKSTIETILCRPFYSKDMQRKRDV